MEKKTYILNWREAHEVSRSNPGSFFIGGEEVPVRGYDSLMGTIGIFTGGPATALLWLNQAVRPQGYQDLTGPPTPQFTSL